MHAKLPEATEEARVYADGSPPLPGYDEREAREETGEIDGIHRLCSATGSSDARGPSKSSRPTFESSCTTQRMNDRAPVSASRLFVRKTRARSQLAVLHLSNVERRPSSVLHPCKAHGTLPSVRVAPSGLRKGERSNAHGTVETRRKPHESVVLHCGGVPEGDVVSGLLCLGLRHGSMSRRRGVVRSEKRNVFGRAERGKCVSSGHRTDIASWKRSKELQRANVAHAENCQGRAIGLPAAARCVSLGGSRRRAPGKE
ncbi:hypothetical protein C8Q77DRAFT_4677 [Trametes polyzona]|nr:hypothetical protein C8Q77DRAFT_4677 [Trametes polyzona]